VGENQMERLLAEDEPPRLKPYFFGMVSASLKARSDQNHRDLNDKLPSTEVEGFH